MMDEPVYGKVLNKYETKDRYIYEVFSGGYKYYLYQNKDNTLSEGIIVGGTYIFTAYDDWGIKHFAISEAHYAYDPSKGRREEVVTVKNGDVISDRIIVIGGKTYKHIGFMSIFRELGDGSVTMGDYNQIHDGTRLRLMINNDFITAMYILR